MNNRILPILLALIMCFWGGDTFAAVGRTVGQFDVSPTGSAQYNIPIWASPGPRGIQPNISLFYDSRSPIGALGIGWSIAGLGAITRCNKTVAQDGTAAPVALVASDGYCINGNRLRLTSASGTYGEAGSTYQTEIADFSQITAVGTAGNGPASFTVQGRNGLTYYYGYTDGNGNGQNSQVIAAGSSPATALTWLLSKVIDRAGNNYVINYTTLSGTLIGTAVPNTIYWTPTTAGASSYVYTMQFNYTPNVPQSSINKYVAGTQVSNSQLLSSIEIISGTTVVKDYFLGYSPSPTTSREQLTSVTECPNTTESSSNCLLPTTISYAGPAAGVSTTSNSALGSSGTNLTARYDLNGDGIPDLVYYNGTSWYVAFGSASGYGSPQIINGVTASPSAFLLGNLNAGTEDGILANKSGTWYYYTWNGTEFNGTSTGLSYDSTATQYQLADLNGDGLPDLVALYSTGSGATLKYNINSTATGGSISFNSAVLGYSWTFGVSAVLLTPDAQFGKLRSYDFNGDGLDDLAIDITVNLPQGGLGNQTYELITTGNTFNPVLITKDLYSGIFFVDWNDDKCTDMVFSGTLYISGCNGTVPSTVTLSGTVVAAMDWDGDGRTDLLVANGSDLGVYLSKGVASPAPTLTSTSVPYSSACQYVTMDATGGGFDDLGCWNSTSGALSYYLHNGVPDLVTKFADGYGNSASPLYVSIAQSVNSSYYVWGDQVYPYLNYIGPLYVANQVTFSDPSTSAGSYLVDYWYAGASMNLLGRGFAGFGAVQTYDSRNAIWDTLSYSRVFPYTGMMNAELKDLNNTSAQSIKVVNTTQVTDTLSNAVNNERYFPNDSNITTKIYEVAGTQNGDTEGGDLITTTSTNYTYGDNYGNATIVATTVTDSDPGSPYVNDTWISTTVNTITPNTSTWCLNQPTQTTVTNSVNLPGGGTAPGGSSIARTVQYVNPDYTNCRETEKVTAPGTAYQVTENYVYDNTNGGAAFGNLTSDTITGVGMAARTTTITWNSTGQFPQTIQNPLLQTITLGFDPNSGMKTSQSDPNSTTSIPIVTQWSYDPFFRKVQETRPDRTYTVWVYDDCATTRGCLLGAHALALNHYVYSSNNSIQTDGTLEFDTIDRPLVDNELLISGSYNRNEVRYDNLGRLASQAIPCAWTNVATTCTYWITNTYDIKNRLTLSQRPISSTNTSPQSTAYGYAGRTTTVTDALKNVTTKVNLVTGALARSKDAMGYYQNFTYDSFGSLLSVTDSASPSNTLFTAAYQYGIQAFKTSSTDVDLGAWSYTVDPLGEVTAYTDAKGQNFLQSYDALSRPWVRTEPDLTTTWTWGNTAASDNIGKLQSVTATTSTSSYVESYTYDGLTRLSTKNITIPGDASYTYSYMYGTNGLLSQLTYPTSNPGTSNSYQVELQYAYLNGFLASITDGISGTVYWAANAMNPRGQVTEESLGNGVVTTRAFDAVTSWVGSIEAGVGGGSALQNNAYLYDYMGNVTQRQDNNPQALTENFYYDADYRLSSSALNGTTNLTMTYDTTGMGNIASRSDVAGGTAWTYDPVRIHAVTQAGTGGYSYTYDGNGNALTRNGYSAAWTSYNYLSGISSAGESVMFQYGPNRQRWQTSYTGSIGTETTYHVGKLLEKVSIGGTTTYRHYIYAGSEPVAIYSRNSAGTNTVNYVLEDHQGSVASIITNSTPGPVADYVSESFTAYGNRRSGETWSGAPIGGDETLINGVSRQGYTWQTALGVSMGLNHMNGRVQDAITGRFLSPDPNIPNHGNTQSWNRYSYVNNNPLTLIDPTGFDDCYDEDGLCPIELGPNVGYLGLGTAIPPGSTFTYGGTPGQVIVTAPDGTQQIIGLGAPAKSQPAVVAAATPAAIVPSAQTGCPNIAGTIAVPLGGGASVTDLLAAVPAAAVAAATLSLSGDTVQQPPQYVTRGGTAAPANLIAGTGPVAPPYNNLTGFSVNSAPNMNPTQLAMLANYPNNQVSYTTTADLLDVGVTVVPTPFPNNPTHATATAPSPLNPVLAAQISAAFMQMPNPANCH